jgi:hypothetical protein
MTYSRKFRSTLLLAGLLALAGGCEAVEEGEDDASGGTSDDGGDGDDGDGGDDGGDDGAGDDGGDDDGGSADSPCTSGVLFAGAPLYLGTDQPDPTGTGLLEEPPVRFRNLLFDGDTLYTHVGEELWAGDMSAAEPQMTRIAGQRQESGTQFRDGACADARMSITHGIARLPDGSLVVADYGANGLLLVSDPLGSSCTVNYYAGTSEPIDAVPPTEFPNEGDTDGPGASAQFRGPEWPVADDQGNVYFVDRGNNKLKVVAPDEARTVTTVLDLNSLEQDIWPGMTLMGGKLYLTGYEMVIEVDPATSEARVVREGYEAFPPVDYGSPAVSSIANNGTDLYISGAGYLWKLAIDGTLTLAAGIGYDIDFPPDGYDPAAEHPADELVLHYSQGGNLFEGAENFLTYHEGAVYYTGRGDDTLVEKITCE